MIRPMLLALLPVAAQAGVTEALRDGILPDVAGFASATEALSEAAAADCLPAAVEPAYQAAWDAWGPIGDLALGPSEAAAYAIAFWPDERGATSKALGALIAAEDPAGRDPALLAEQSVAARGLMALDLMLRDEGFDGYAPGSYGCDLVRTLAADLAAQGAALASGWQEEATALTTAGASGNARYLSGTEAFRALYTQALAGLEFTALQRLGRPMGSFDAPKPRRAEAWRSGRPLAEAMASAEAAARLAGLLAAGPLPRTEAAIEAVRAAASAIGDPSFQDVEDPQARLKIEILQTRVRALSDAIAAEVGAPLGIEAGFNSGDGD